MKEFVFEKEGRKRENFGFFFLIMGWHGRATIGTGRANLLVKLGKKNSVFSSFLDNYLQNKLKQNKQN